MLQQLQAPMAQQKNAAGMANNRGGAAQPNTQARGAAGTQKNPSQMAGIYPTYGQNQNQNQMGNYGYSQQYAQFAQQQAQFAQQQYGQGQQFGRQDSAGGYDYNQYAQYQQQYGGYGSGFQQQDGYSAGGYSQQQQQGVTRRT
jgi:hypothetical protein